MISSIVELKIVHNRADCNGSLILQSALWIAMSKDYIGTAGTGVNSANYWMEKQGYKESSKLNVWRSSCLVWYMNGET